MAGHCFQYPANASFWGRDYQKYKRQTYYHQAVIVLSKHDKETSSSSRRPYKQGYHTSQ